MEIQSSLRKQNAMLLNTTILKMSHRLPIYNGIHIYFIAVVQMVSLLKINQRVEFSIETTIGAAKPSAQFINLARGCPFSNQQQVGCLYELLF